mmetsp:Transcript_32799/g.33162  ORF Transcript_32799/g.33162 Transcript_32799/m.33162 type:complete len:80 (-) Transcript_32799:545-784(-)
MIGYLYIMCSMGEKGFIHNIACTHTDNKYCSNRELPTHIEKETKMIILSPPTSFFLSFLFPDRLVMISIHHHHHVHTHH